MHKIRAERLIGFKNQLGHSAIGGCERVNALGGKGIVAGVDFPNIIKVAAALAVQEEHAPPAILAKLGPREVKFEGQGNIGKLAGIENRGIELIKDPKAHICIGARGIPRLPVWRKRGHGLEGQFHPPWQGTKDLNTVPNGLIACSCRQIHLERIGRGKGVGHTAGLKGGTIAKIPMVNVARWSAIDESHWNSGANKLRIDHGKTGFML